MSDEKYIILRREARPEGFQGLPTWIEVGTVESDRGYAEGVLREFLDEHGYDSGEYMVVQPSPWAQRVMVKAHTEYDVDRIEDDPEPESEEQPGGVAA